MKPSEKLLFKYPKEIYNEGEVLTIYRKQFPDLVNEYESVAKKTYCNPNEYKKIVKDKSKRFDSLLDDLIKRYKTIPHSLENLIEIDKALHKNYAFNFWLISYAIGDGPLAFHYVELLELSLKKLYINDKNRFLLAKKALLKTDFEIFYHKILMTSMKLVDLLHKDKKYREFLNKAKEERVENRKFIYDKLISHLRLSNDTDQWMRHLLERHGNNKTPLYHLFNQGIDYYSKNKKLKKEFGQTKKIIQDTLKDADKKLDSEESRKIRKLYSLIKAMLTAKDFIFGRKDLKLYSFWKPLTTEIIGLYNKKYNSDILEEGRSFLLLPWALADDALNK